MAGIDIKAHDVRFVEDNWESPVLFMFILSHIIDLVMQSTSVQSLAWSCYMLKVFEEILCYKLGCEKKLRVIIGFGTMFTYKSFPLIQWDFLLGVVCFDFRLIVLPTRLQDLSIYGASPRVVFEFE